MPHYKYRATDATGTLVKATADSHNERELRDALLLQNLDVTHIKKQRRLSDVELGKKRVPPMEIVQFSKQMATFVRAGISIPEGLDVIIESTSSKKFQEILRDVSEAIVRGVPFSDALAEHERLLPPYFIGLCRAGELTGRIDTVLEQLGDYVERDLDARSKVKSALTYPAIVMGMSFVTVGVLLVVVLPKFSTFFKEFHTKLPPTTRALIATSHLMSQLWFVFPALLITGVGTAAWMRQTPRGRNVRDRLLLRIPVMGEVVKFAVLERFCRVFGSMTRAGVSLPEAIQAAADSTNNTVYEATLLDVQEQMLAGAGIAEPIASSGKFPRIVVQLLRVGEATGSLDHQLDNAANYYNGQLTYKLKKLTTLIEPAVVIFMGLIVGFVALALVSAMYGIYHAPALTQP
jgi:type IV pilus assembly protein PilC